jgi:hypothetical protein
VYGETPPLAVAANVSLCPTVGVVGELEKPTDSGGGGGDVPILNVYVSVWVQLNGEMVGLVYTIVVPEVTCRFLTLSEVPQSQPA